MEQLAISSRPPMPSKDPGVKSVTVILPTVLVEELDSMADEINATRRPHPKATRASLIREALETVKRHKLPPYDGP